MFVDRATRSSRACFEAARSRAGCARAPFRPPADRVRSPRPAGWQRHLPGAAGRDWRIGRIRRKDAENPTSSRPFLSYRGRYRPASWESWSSRGRLHGHETTIDDALSSSESAAPSLRDFAEIALRRRHVHDGAAGEFAHVACRDLTSARSLGCERALDSWQRRAVRSLLRARSV